MTCKVENENIELRRREAYLEELVRTLRLKIAELVERKPDTEEP